MTSRGSRDIPSLIEGLAATPDLLEAATLNARDDVLDAAPDGEWSARTVLAHLRDDEFMVTRLRLARMIVEEHPTIAPFDESAWADSRWTGRDGLQELLSDFRLQREASMMILRRLGASDWLRTGLQPEYGAFDLHWWMEHCLEHDETHVAQISAALAKAKGE